MNQIEYINELIKTCARFCEIMWSFNPIHSLTWFTLILRKLYCLLPINYMVHRW